MKRLLTFSSLWQMIFAKLFEIHLSNISWNLLLAEIFNSVTSSGTYHGQRAATLVLWDANRLAQWIERGSSFEMDLTCYEFTTFWGPLWNPGLCIFVCRIILFSCTTHSYFQYGICLNNFVETLSGPSYIGFFSLTSKASLLWHRKNSRVRWRWRWRWRWWCHPTPQ